MKAENNTRMPCDCIDKANKLLVAHNTVIDARECLDMKTGKIRRALTVPTRKINSKSRRPVYIVIAKYCPLCGSKQAQP